MTFIKFPDGLDVPRKYTADESSAMYECLVWLHRNKKIKDGVIEFFHESMKKMPHEHIESMIGPYCVICHCDLPGPNGEWE